jgi:GT2 family glycosyltransferase
LLEEIGLLREDYFMYYEELDFSVRARRAGWEILYTPAAYIHHRESSSMGKTSPLKTYYMFRNRWLFIRRFGQGLDYPIFLLYFLFLALPLNAIRFVKQANWEHLKSLWRGLRWNLRSINISHQIPGLENTLHQR